MSEAATRRGLIKNALTGSLRTALDVVSGSPLGAILDDPPPPLASPGRAEPSRSPAVGSERCAELPELLALADRSGLSRRLDEVRGLARISIRLAPTEGGEESHAGGSPSLPLGSAWPERDGRALRFVARLQPREAGRGAGHFDGGLLFFVADDPGIGDAGHAPRRCVALSPSAGGEEHRGQPVATTSAAPHPLGLTGELVLPRAWAAAVEALGLDEEERDAWQLTRRRLAELQGVDPASKDRRIHRLYGYPDETSGSMPLACELASRDLDPGAEMSGKQVEQARLNCVRWELLAQLDSDPMLGWTWGGRARRLYLWTDCLAAPHSSDATIWALAR